MIIQLRRQISQISESDSELKFLYRGTYITNNELELLKNRKKKPFLINGFISTSKEEIVAINFTVEEKVDLKKILFVFSIGKKDMKNLASIQKYYSWW